MSGQLRATSGSIHLFGQEITHLSDAARAHKGLGRAFQLTNLFPNLSALENVRLAVASRHRIGHVFWQMASARADIAAKAMAYLEQVGMAHRSDSPVANLSDRKRTRLNSSTY